LRKLEFIIKESSHVLRMEDSRIPRQATQWELRGYKRKPGRQRKNWMDIGHHQTRFEGHGHHLG